MNLRRYLYKKMEIKSRIASILKADHLDFSVTGLQVFDLSELNLINDLDFKLPSNIRLGHLVEKIVSELIKSSVNYNVLQENIQIIQDKKTIGEIDFIIENTKTSELMHLELAYKFYLFDPNISANPMHNWIGPNRNDSLKEKLKKLKHKQFPLLYHNAAKSRLNSLKIDEISQALCLLVSLFIPYEYKANFSPIYKNAIKGYYIKHKTFISIDDPKKTYYLPSKKEWGITPSENKNWTSFSGIEQYVDISIKEKQAPLCWQKHNNSFSAFFIVWW